MNTDLEIKNCDKKFADMVIHLHNVYKKRIKFNFEINFSGNLQDFKFYFNKIDPESIPNIISDNKGKEV